MEIDGHKLDLGLAPWKRFMILGGLYFLVWNAMSLTTIDAEIKGFLLAAALMGTQFYFQTHKDQPAATCDTEDDPDVVPVPAPIAKPSQTAMDMELAYGKSAVVGITSTPGWNGPLPKPENIGMPEK